MRGQNRGRTRNVHELGDPDNDSIDYIRDTVITEENDPKSRKRPRQLVQSLSKQTANIIQKPDLKRKLNCISQDPCRTSKAKLKPKFKSQDRSGAHDTDCSLITKKALLLGAGLENSLLAAANKPNSAFNTNTDTV